MLTKLLFPDLQLFADGADGGAGATGEAPASAVAAGQQTSVPTSRRQSNPNANTIYGRGDDDTGSVQADAQTNGRQKMSFDDLLKADPDYKAAYDERVQKAINGRFKQAKSLEEFQEKLTPMLELLGQKYGIKADNPDELIKAIQEDDSYYEEEALEKGISVDSLKQLKKMERENAALKKQMQQTQMDEQNRQRVLNLQAQAEAMQQTYPGFDLNAEMQSNPVFARMVWESGIPVKTAFEAVHHDQILSGAIQTAAQRTQQMAAQSVQANMRRPVENGVNSAPAALHITDPKKLTREQRQDIRNRVNRGERIVW